MTQKLTIRVFDVKRVSNDIEEKEISSLLVIFFFFFLGKTITPHKKFPKWTAPHKKKFALRSNISVTFAWN